MKYNQLNLKAKPSRRRVGRGISAGQGKTAGRGTKGQGARSGKKFGPMFQGGQLPLVKATPKSKGFKSLRTPTQVVYLDTLNNFKGKVADNQSLYQENYIASPYQSVKVIMRGQLSKPITLRVQGASKSVQATLTKNGGSFEKVAVPLKEAKKETSKNS